MQGNRSQGNSSRGCHEFDPCYPPRLVGPIQVLLASGLLESVTYTATPSGVSVLVKTNFGKDDGTYGPQIAINLARSQGLLKRPKTEKVGDKKEPPKPMGTFLPEDISSTGEIAPDRLKIIIGRKQKVFFSSVFMAAWRELSTVLPKKEQFNGKDLADVAVRCPSFVRGFACLFKKANLQDYALVVPQVLSALPDDWFFRLPQLEDEKNLQGRKETLDRADSDPSSSFATSEAGQRTDQ